jgi:hypothetical protein
MRPRTRALVSAAVAVPRLALMAGTFSGADWSTGTAWLMLTVSLAVFSAGLAVMLRVRHAPVAVATFLTLTVVSLAWMATMHGGL